MEKSRIFEKTLSMKGAVDDYRTSVDSVKAFFDECCQIVPSRVALTKKLYSEYEDWCGGAGVKPYKKMRFFKHLQEHLPDPERKRAHAGPEYYSGIDVKPQADWGIKPSAP